MRNLLISAFFKRSKLVLHWFHVRWKFVLRGIFGFMFQMRPYTGNKAIFCQGNVIFAVILFIFTYSRLCSSFAPTQDCWWLPVWPCNFCRDILLFYIRFMPDGHAIYDSCTLVLRWTFCRIENVRIVHQCDIDKFLCPDLFTNVIMKCWCYHTNVIYVSFCPVLSHQCDNVSASLCQLW